MNNTLLIWEIVPEETELYLVPNNISQKYENYLKEAHNRFINVDDMNDGMKFLNTALAENDSEKGFEEYLGIFRKYKCDLANHITDTTITAVYFSGFVL